MGHATPQDAAGQFSQRAASYASSAAHFNAESLRLIGRLASEGAYGLGVDVATGPGFTAFEVAPFCDLVVATDPAIGMLQKVRDIAIERGITNVSTVPAYADKLPFEDSSTDLVTCRTAPHHFPSIIDFLREVGRILSPGGTFIIADTSAPEDDNLDRWMNKVELWRDPTHMRDIKHSEWRGLIADAGLVQDFEATTRVYMTARDWGERTGVAGEDIDELVQFWASARKGAVEAFQIARIPGEIEDYAFSWPVFVGRARLPA